MKKIRNNMGIIAWSVIVLEPYGYKPIISQMSLRAYEARKLATKPLTIIPSPTVLVVSKSPQKRCLAIIIMIHIVGREVKYDCALMAVNSRLFAA
jgi:hypothetical protein